MELNPSADDEAKPISRDLMEKILRAQKNEITEHFIYGKLSKQVKDVRHLEILVDISRDEMNHYNILRDITKMDVGVDKFKMYFYFLISRFFGLNFGLKLMERGEDFAQDAYEKIKEISPKVEDIIRDENKHEREIISFIDEEHLKYISSMVLGLNDALVELSGALIGFTLALQDPFMVGIVGLITGIAASMSMATSEFLSTKHEESDKNPLKASLYTGLAYIFTVLLLSSPYLLIKELYFCMGLVILNSMLLILIFTFYISIAKGMNFRKRFLEMAAISLGVAIINFFIGLGIRNLFGLGV
ncbi:VIT1/CCC1 transporter family protein [Candidatus Bathyarchaeota archaeon]|nr:VIT1/CCC1 transporter family protein [Candidatus Bathyarchaeota archaeon]